MGERREIDSIIKEIYMLLKKNKNKEISINEIAKTIQTRWDTTKRALELLTFLSIVKERKDGDLKNSTKFYRLI